jgi:hypothetical protein
MCWQQLCVTLAPAYASEQSTSCGRAVSSSQAFQEQPRLVCTSSPGLQTLRSPYKSLSPKFSTTCGSRLLDQATPLCPLPFVLLASPADCPVSLVLPSASSHQSCSYALSLEHIYVRDISAYMFTHLEHHQVTILCCLMALAYHYTDYRIAFAYELNLQRDIAQILLYALA